MPNEDSAAKRAALRKPALVFSIVVAAGSLIFLGMLFLARANASNGERIGPFVLFVLPLLAASALSIVWGLLARNAEAALIGGATLLTLIVITPLASNTKKYDGEAMAALRTINTAELSYLSDSGGRRYGTIEELLKQNFLDRAYLDRAKGYRFSIVIQPDPVYGSTYTAYARPDAPGSDSYVTGPDGDVRPESPAK